jgi:hypothetical protein
MRPGVLRPGQDRNASNLR